MEPKKFLFISWDGLIGDIAWQIKKEGNNVKCYIKNQKKKDVADGFVEKTDDWEKDVDWADVIVFDEVDGFGKIAQLLRKKGKLAIGGTPYTDRLEEDRAFGQEEMKNHGIAIIPYREFTDFDEAINYVKNNPGKYVIKPSMRKDNKELKFGGEPSKSLLFVGEEDDGRDVIEVLSDYKSAWSKKIPYLQLQKRIIGVEIAVGAFFNGKEFVYPININFEHKKLFSGEIGPSTGEMGCYDEKTEVLTKSGWKFFKNVFPDDKFLTINKSGRIEYQKPTDIICLSNHKKLMTIKNQTIDIAITLNHNMYGIEGNQYRSGKRDFRFVQAKYLPRQFVIPRTGIWKGKRVDFFILPKIEKFHMEGKRIKKKKINDIKINILDWLRFLGYYIAEGSCSRSYRISISCSKNKDEVRKMILKLPFNFKEIKSEFYTYNKQLWTYLSKLGKANNKYVPDFVKELMKEDIKVFLDWYGKGDSNINNGFRIFYTSSRKLAGDIQELLLKIGRTGVIKKRARKGKIWIKDHWAKINYPQFEILERVKKQVSWIDKKDIEVINYKGRVYCVTVPNHTLYIRRNGKPCFCGNTTMFWSAPNKLFNQTLKKMETKLAEEGYVGYIDLNCMVNNYGIYPLEFTSRFGYPTISIQQEAMITPIGEFFYKLANKEDPKLKVKSGFQIGVRIVVPPFPFEDKETFNVKSKDSVIFFKKQIDGVHIEDVKLIENQWVVTGNSGGILIVCATGQTMKQARDQVYNKIKNIKIPNMYYRDDIGERWFEDSDKLHNWGYLREI